MGKAFQISKLLASAVAFLLVTMFLFATPSNANATQVTKSVDSTMTITMQQSSDDDDPSGDDSADDDSTNDSTDNDATDNDSTDDKATDDNSTTDDSATNDDKGSAEKADAPVSSSEKGGGLPLTGDVLLLAILGIIALFAGSAFCIVESKKLSAVQGAHVRKSSNGVHMRPQNLRDVKKRIMAVVIASVLLAATCFGCFASKTNALAEGVDASVKCTSAVTIDESGNVISANVTVLNNTLKAIDVETIVAPTELEGWTATFTTTSVAVSGSATGTWNGKTVPSDILDQVKENGSATLTFSLTFSTEPEELDFSAFSLEETNWVYDKTQKTPSVNCTGSLVEGTDYTVSYGENVNAGEGTVTITGIGDYCGTKDFTFVINPQEITDEQLDAITLVIPEKGFVYDGNAKEPSLENLPGGVTENDYEMVYESNVSATDSGASVTLTFKNNFFCNTQKVLNFVINKAPITISGITANNKTYDGSDDASLNAENVIYTGVVQADKENLYLDISALSGTFDDKNVGTGKTVIIAGLTLAGDATKNYELASTGQQANTTADITAREVTITWSPAGEAKYPYDGATHTPTATVGNVVDEETLSAVLAYKDSSDTAVSMIPSAVGAYTATVESLSGATASNYALPATGLTKDFTIFERGGFWLAPANAEDPEAAAVKGRSAIVEDMQVLHGTLTQTSAGKDKTAVAAEYTNYMNGKDAEGNTSEIRLYTKWYGDTKDASGEAQAANKWIEMRVIQVGEHDDDGSAVTFMPTHSLPTAKSINGAGTNKGGWTHSVMRTSTMDSYVAAGMKDIANDTVILTLNKVSTSGEYGDWTQGVITQDKFWLLSVSEVFGTGDNNKCIPSMFYEEGSQYAWFASQGVNAKNGTGIKNEPLSSLWRARSGNPTAGNNYAVCCLRSPDVSTSNRFGYTGTGGDLNSIEISLWNSSVVPAFSF